MVEIDAEVVKAAILEAIKVSWGHNRQPGYDLDLLALVLADVETAYDAVVVVE